MLFLFLFISVHFYSAEITGETVSGEVVAQPVTLNITVLGIPSLSLLKPQNETYLTTENLLLNFIVSNADFIWYNLDDNPPNTTITGNTIFNTTEGEHTLNLYANNSQGETSKNVVFTVNASKFQVIYSEWAEINKGSSTDFNKSSYEDLQNLSDIIFENTEWGKIKFNEAINVTNDSETSDNEINLNATLNISNNRIELNSTTLPNFDKAATLYLYNLTFSNPRILRDGSICLSSICTKESYSSETGTLIFNVTGFTIYSAEETPVDGDVAAGGGSGAGGIGITPVEDFTIDKTVISISLKKGEIKKEIIIIKNTGNTPLSLNLTDSRLENFMKISETSFNLNDGESKLITLEFSASEETVPDLYVGKLVVNSNGLEKVVLISIGVETRGALFDVELEIPSKFEYVLPGEELSAKIILFNLGEKEISTSIDYIIKDENGNLIVSEKENFTIQDQLTLAKTFKIPEGAVFGKYILYVRVNYLEEVAIASEFFNVGKRPFLKNRILLYTLIGILTLTIFFIIFYKKKKKIKISSLKKENLKKLKIIERRMSGQHLAKKKFIKR